jgi:hypothetical protein
MSANVKATTRMTPIGLIATIGAIAVLGACEQTRAPGVQMTTQAVVSNRTCKKAGRAGSGDVSAVDVTEYISKAVADSIDNASTIGFRNAINDIVTLPQIQAIYIPAGSYVLTSPIVINRRKTNGTTVGDLTICGEGDSSVIIQGYKIGPPNPPPQGSDNGGLITYQGDGTDAGALNSFTLANLKFKGYRDPSDLNNPKVFREFYALIRLNGTSDVKIDHVSFYDFQGDAIMLGLSDYTPPIVRHNKGVSISNSKFDGADKLNRSGIVIMNAEDLLVSNNEFMNTTNNGMPGAIIIEPDQELGLQVLPKTPHPNLVTLKNIRILDNKFTSIGIEWTSVATSDADLGIPNPVTGSVGPLSGHGIAVNIPNTSIVLDGLSVRGNTFTDTAYAGIRFFNGNAKHVQLEPNTFVDTAAPPFLKVAASKTPQFTFLQQCDPTTGCMLATQPGHLQGTGYTPITTGSVFKSGDFDGDGRTDRIEILPGSTATPSQRTTIIRSGGVGLPVQRMLVLSGQFADLSDPSYRFDVADVDGDGKDDLIGLGLTDISGRLYGGSLYYWSAASGSRIAWQFSPGCTYKLTLADFNRDGKADVLGIPTDNWGRYTGIGAITVVTSIAIGTQVPPINVSAADPSRTNYIATVGDFNGDGFSDLLWVGQVDTFGRYSGTGAIFTLDGPTFDGSTKKSIDTNAVAWTNYIFKTGDFDGDFRTDILGIGAVDTNLRYSGTGCLFTRLSNPNVTSPYFSWICNASYWSNYTFQVGDFDGDRHSDVAGMGAAQVNGLYSGSGGLFVRYGGPTLPLERVWSSAMPWLVDYSIEVVDRNGDGRSDLFWSGSMTAAPVSYRGYGNFFDVL